MNELISKSSLYDTVSMIIPGFIMLFYFAEKVGMTCYWGKNGSLSIAYYICIFALSYLVGLMIHYFSKLVYNPCLRNNRKHIRKARCRLRKDIQDKVLNEYYEDYYSTIRPSSVPIMEAQVSFIRSMTIVIPIIFLMECCNLCCGNGKNIFSICPYCVIVSCFVIEIISICVMKCIQKEICFLVVEDSYYISKVKEKDRKLRETMRKNEAGNSEDEQN